MRRRITKATPKIPALARLGLAAPPPMVGRRQELASAARGLAAGPAVVIRGAVGAGKTRLARALLDRLDASDDPAAPRALVGCQPGDRAAAVLSRAERALDALPGSLSETLTHTRCVLVIDDFHHLSDEDAAFALARLLPRGDRARAGRVVLCTRDDLPGRRAGAVHRLVLEGLDEAAARELWQHLEQTYGPTPAAACDDALPITRGMPLALRRAYARAVFGPDAWTIDALPGPVRAALEAFSVIDAPAGPAAVRALLCDAYAEPALIELVSRQLVDPQHDGRFTVHDVVRDEVLAAADAATRERLERAAAALWLSAGRGRGDDRPAWRAGDDGALPAVSAIERVRRAALHLLRAGDVPAAVGALTDHRALVLGGGASGEIQALVDDLVAASASPDPDADDGGADVALRALRADIAMRQGRVAEALEMGLAARHRGEGTLDPVAAAELRYLSGEVAAAAGELERLCDADGADARCRAAAVLAEIELARGNPARAEAVATAAFERDRARMNELARARLHMAMAAIEAHAGRIGSARAALARAAAAGQIEPGLAALIEARRAACLAREGRLSEAEDALAGAERGAREVDAVAVADEVRRGCSMVRARRGDTVRAADTLRELIASRRRRGNEVGALELEVELAEVLARRGDIAAAAELVSAASTSAARRRLGGLVARAELVCAMIDVAEARLVSARRVVEALRGNDAADAGTRARAAGLLGVVASWEAQREVAGAGGDDLGALDALEIGWIEAERAMVAGDSGAALARAQKLAVDADRADRAEELCAALGVVARLQLARGCRPAALAAAARVARESEARGLVRARIHTHLVQAALARDADAAPGVGAAGSGAGRPGEAGEAGAALSHVRAAGELAARAGLPIERLVAAQAESAVAGTARVAPVESAAAATMSQAAVDAAARLLSDLGLTAARPFRVVSAGGAESFVADADPDLLRLRERALAIDGVREVVYRSGGKLADLRRRSLLKRLLYLFAGAPGKIFSKEQIVGLVWDVEYHPLRHDAALFTNIMRIRRLLGADGSDLIRVSEDGYRFVPPADYAFVEPVRS